MDRGTWWATVHGVAKSWPRLSISAHMSSRFIDFVVIYNLLSFLRLNKVPRVHVCEAFSLVIHLLIDTCLHVLAIVNNASVNMRVHIYLRNTDFLNIHITQRNLQIRYDINEYFRHIFHIGKNS